MRILLDESIRTPMVNALRNTDHIWVWMRDINPGADDLDVLALAQETDAILVTEDKDFGDLLFRDKRRARGVILLRLWNLSGEERARRLLDVMAAEAELLETAFTVISHDGYRMRPL